MRTELDYEFTEWDKSRDFDVLVGQVITKVTASTYEIIFETEDYTYMMYHDQDCCERVYVESIVGDLEDLIGEKILLAEVRNSFDNPLDEDEESFTWTFYTIRTLKTSIDIRWYGRSNGYYSEEVTLVRIK